jgi:hypothetical protein
MISTVLDNKALYFGTIRQNNTNSYKATLQFYKTGQYEEKSI